MADEKITRLKHLKLTAMRCSAMVTGKIAELAEAISLDLDTLDRSKQDNLEFDQTPIFGSSNPVTSGGIFTALSDKSNNGHGHTKSEISDFPTSMKNPAALTVGSKTYDGSSATAITKSDLSLGNVENKSSSTIRSEITSANVTNALGFTPINSSLKGAANGVAELDSNGKVPASQLPSYVDDVVEGTYVSTTSFKNSSGVAVTGENDKIYVDTATNKTYRWAGSSAGFVEISASLALGETSSTAYRGDRGKIAYDHSQITSGNPHNVTKGDLGLANTVPHYYGVCDTAKTDATKVVTIDDFVLSVGVQVTVKFTNASGTDAEGDALTMNVNGTGAFPMRRYGSTAMDTSTTTSGWQSGAIQTFTYDGEAWVREFWYNTTYSNVALGHGYATCSTAAATTAKTASLSSYKLVTGGIVSVRFTYDVPANATLNINSTGAKNIYNRNAKITDGVIKAGDIATFTYSSYYRLISIDRPIDTTLTENSNNLITSGAVYSAIGNINTILDSINGEVV